MLKNKTALRIVSLIAAILLWLYVMGEVDPETTRKIGMIPVNVVNAEQLEEQGLAVVFEENVFISATIKGKRSEVNNAKNTGITASIDVSDCKKGKNTLKITVNLPDGVILENSSRNTLKVKVEEMVYIDKPVNIEFAEAKGDTKTVPWVLEYYPKAITVSGAKSSVNKVEKLQGTVDENEAEIKNDKWVDVTVIPVDSDGNEVKGVTLKKEKAKAEIQKLSVKVVTLDIDTTAIEAEGFDADETLKDLTHLRIAGPKETIKNINTLKGTAIPGDGGKVVIRIELPEKVYILRGDDDGKIIWDRWS